MPVVIPVNCSPSSFTDSGAGAGVAVVVTVTVGAGVGSGSGVVVVVGEGDGVPDGVGPLLGSFVCTSEIGLNFAAFT